MIDLFNNNAEICVIGRTDFSTGIGAVCYAACELLARSFPVCIFPTNSSPIHGDHVVLPSGREIPISTDLNQHKVFFYTDVLWNGEYDLNYTRMPDKGLRLVHIAYDSDEFPAKWVEICNQKFDAVYFSSRHLIDIGRQSGIKKPMGCLPIGLDLEPLLIKPPKERGTVIRFGAVAAFHPRKGMDKLVEAFIQEFGNHPQVELVLHSNLSMGNVLEKILNRINNANITNIRISGQNLSAAEKTTLLESVDIFVNCSQGEGYSIGPREALALGKILVLSDIGAHQDLLGLPGVFNIPTSIRMPARYPEIDNQIFGNQYAVSVEAVKQKLREAYAFCLNEETSYHFLQRRKRANEFSFSKLVRNYAETITPDIGKFKPLAAVSKYTEISPACAEIAIATVGSFGKHLKTINRTILSANDGGFFSVFNVFMSHLVWDSQEERCHLTLPDWDVGRLLERQAEKKLVSFCYGTPEDGNIWLKLFQPLYGLSPEQMNDQAFLYEKSTLPQATWNEIKEPSLTYIHAYDLYTSAFFPAFRRQYHKFFTAHIKLLPHFQQEIEQFQERHFSGKYMIAAHVKHPSHMIEQPGKCIAHGQSFIQAIQHKIAKEKGAQENLDWGVYLATDQDRVVAQFKEAFGDRVCFFEDVRRTKISEDEFYDTLSDEEKASEGFQVQHLVAASPENWSTRMAWEVIRDAMVMARCKALFHVVSNVSTAVSYFNPEMELYFVDE